LIITDEKTVEVAHEALLLEWGRLKEWIEQDRENLRLSRRLEAECKEWQRHDCSNEWLLTDAWLAAIADWVEKTQPRLSQLEQEFLQESLEKRDREIQAKVAQERQLRELAESRQREAEARAIAEIEKSMEAECRAKAERRKTFAAITAGVFAALSLGFGLLAKQWENKATNSKAISLGTLIAESKQSFDKGDQLEALIASVKALTILREMDNTNLEALDKLQGVVYQVQERNRLGNHKTAVLSLSFSPDGTIVSATKDGTITFWSSQGTFIRKIVVGSPTYSVSFSPDGNTLASASKDGAIKLWTKDGVFKKTLLQKHKQLVWKVNFSPDGNTLASASKDGTINLWTNNGTFLRKIFVGSPAFSVNFSPDGNAIASANKDGTIKIWTKDGVLLNTIKVEEGSIYDVSFSPDGQTLASAGDNKIIKLWKKTGLSWKETVFWKNLIGHESAVYSVNFSRNGMIVSGGSSDHYLKLWSRDGTLFKTFNCHSFVNEVKFNFNADTVGCATDKKTLIIWSLKLVLNKTPDVDALLDYSCSWLHDYFTTNPEAKPFNLCLTSFYR
jgi:hypothetical protein